MTENGRTEKYRGYSDDWTKLSNAIHTAIREYAMAGFDIGDVTAYEMKREAWERLAEYYGFKITWPTPEKSR